MLRLRGVPQGGIVCIVGVDMYAALLDANLLVDASSSGSTAALREAQIGRLRGFTIVESTRIADDEIVAFHRDAFTLSVKPETIPAGAGFGAIVTGGGFGLRYLRGFDMRHAEDLSLVGTMYTVVPMPMYKIQPTADGSEPDRGRRAGRRPGRHLPDEHRRRRARGLTPVERLTRGDDR